MGVGILAEDKRSEFLDQPQPQQDEWPDGFIPYDTSEGPARTFEIPRIPEPLPVNHHVELCLLGCLLNDPKKTLEAIAGITTPDHFSDEAHARLFEVMVELIEQDREPTEATLPLDIVAAVGGKPLLFNLRRVAFTHHAKEYARSLEDYYLRRQVAIRGDEAARCARDGEDGRAIASRLSRELDDITARVETGLVVIGEAAQRAVLLAEDAYKRDGALPGVSTGLPELDRKLGGLEPSGLYILAARPSMGKTALAVWIAYAVARAGHSVHFVSCEMSEVQLGRRVACGLAGLSLIDAKNGLLDAGAFSNMVRAQQHLASLPIVVDEARDLAEIKAHCRTQARKGLGLIVIDHIGLVRVDETIMRHGRTAVVTEITAELKQLAKELRVPVLALSQLSRANESREEKRPQLSDLRDSGSLEQDADVVMFIYRDHYYVERARPSRRPDETDAEHANRVVTWNEADAASRGRAELVVAKNRDGGIGTIELAFEEKTARFRPAPQDGLE